MTKFNINNFHVSIARGHVVVILQILKRFVGIRTRALLRIFVFISILVFVVNRRGRRFDVRTHGTLRCDKIRMYVFTHKY